MMPRRPSRGPRSPARGSYGHDLATAIRKLLPVARKVQRKLYEQMAIKARAYGESPDEYATEAYRDVRHAISYAEHALMEAETAKGGAQ